MGIIDLLLASRSGLYLTFPGAGAGFLGNVGVAGLDVGNLGCGAAVGQEVLDGARPGAAVLGFLAALVAQIADLERGGQAGGLADLLHQLREAAVPVGPPGALGDQDLDAGYEAGLKALSTVLAGGNFINHTGGMIEGLLTMSYAKCAADYELMDMAYVTAAAADREGADEALATLADIAPGGHFLGTGHTLGHFPYQPTLQDYNTFEQWDEEGRVNTDERGRRRAMDLLAAYQPPPLDAAIDEALGEFVARRSKELGG